MSEEKKTESEGNGGSQEHERVSSRQDQARERIRQAVHDQQDALAAQQRAVQSASDAFLAEQELAEQEKKGLSAEEVARGQKAAGESRRTFLKISTGVIAGAAIASVIQVPMYDGLVSARNKDVHTLQGSLSQANSQVAQLQSQVATLQTRVSTTTGFLTLSTSERAVGEAIVETIIPSDSSGPGAKEAGALYFIDRQLAGDYGHSANMFMEGPFIETGQTGPITVGEITYSGGSPKVRVGAGTRYQYPLTMREYWRTGLAALEAYANSAFGGNFETLKSSQQMQILQDLWNNIPPDFGNIVPEDFAYELTFMTWCGFLMDPLYGGNQNMVGWTYTGYTGVNQGNAYGEGLTQAQLMVADKFTRLQPASLGQYQNPQSGSSNSSSASGQQSSSNSTTTSQSSGSSGSSSQASGSSSSQGSSSSSQSSGGA